MNYRHAFHAGNFADCLKHAVLVWLLHALRRKQAGFFVLDTHAGPGHTDLTSGPAVRTGEWQRGIARLLDDPPGPLAEYVGLVRRLELYPGSPALTAALLRPDDRLACCELHPEDHATLRRIFRDDARVSVHRRDGWEALGALLPPSQRRGLVLVDPPYEEADEFARLAAGVRTGHRQFGTGIFAAWYPIKHRAPVRAFHNAMKDSGIRDIVAAEMWLREPLDPARLNGCGMLVINPPFRFADELTPVLMGLLARLGDGEAGAGTVLIRVADE